VNETILIIDDEDNLRKTLAKILAARGYDILEASDGIEAVELLRASAPDLVFTDWKMPVMGGEEILRYMRKDPRLDSIPVIVITAFGSSHSTIEAVRLGAYDFVTKPFDLDEISLTAERALAHSSLNHEVAHLRAQIGRNGVAATGRLIGSSRAMVDVFKMIGKVAETDSTVLICGESGTGKELVAEAIHAYSRRKDKPFVVVNCAALPEGLLESELFGHERGAFTGAVGRKTGRFEVAEGGTIFLDEIAELSPGLQSKLLRVLQEHTYERVGGTETVYGNFRARKGVSRGPVLSLERSPNPGALASRAAVRYRTVGRTLPGNIQRKKWPSDRRLFGRRNPHAPNVFVPWKRPGAGEYGRAGSSNGARPSRDAWPLPNVDWSWARTRS
jgi:two-component system response regulator AtoC